MVSFAVRWIRFSVVLWTRTPCAGARSIFGSEHVGSWQSWLFVIVISKKDLRETLSHLQSKTCHIHCNYPNQGLDGEENLLYLFQNSHDLIYNLQREGFFEILSSVTILHIFHTNTQFCQYRLLRSNKPRRSPSLFAEIESPLFCEQERSALEHVRFFWNWTCL